MELKPVAYYRGPFGSKFGIPRQSGLAGAVTGRIVFEPAFRDANAVRGLEGFDRIWLIWGFSANRPAKGEWQPTVRPPRLGGNARLGVWATRSPFRPNPLGLSAVRLLRVEAEGPEGPVLHVSGADLMDGTPVYDIKPYIVYADSFPDAASGFADGAPVRRCSRTAATSRSLSIRVRIRVRIRRRSGRFCRWIPGLPASRMRRSRSASRSRASTSVSRSAARS